jgi:hypothetical protein
MFIAHEEPGSCDARLARSCLRVVKVDPILHSDRANLIRGLNGAIIILEVFPPVIHGLVDVARVVRGGRASITNLFFSCSRLDFFGKLYDLLKGTVEFRSEYVIEIVVRCAILKSRRSLNHTFLGSPLGEATIENRCIFVTVGPQHPVDPGSIKAGALIVNHDPGRFLDPVHLHGVHELLSSWEHERIFTSHIPEVVKIDKASPWNVALVVAHQGIITD